MPDDTMPDAKPRSKYYLPRNSPEEQAEAAKLLRWNWSPRARDLLTQYPRRVQPYAPLTLEEVRIQNAALTKPFPEEMIMDFQRELGGVTYPTVGDDGDWATWGLTYIEDYEEDVYKAADELVLLCCEYNTARPDGYSLAADGRLWDTIPVASNARLEIERIAFLEEVPKPFRESRKVHVLIRDIPLTQAVFLNACQNVFHTLRWSADESTQDEYGCIWQDTSGWARYSYEFEDDQHLFFFGTFLDTDHVNLFYWRMRELLPQHEISVMGMPTPTAPG